MNTTNLKNCYWGVEIHNLNLKNASRKDLLNVGKLLLKHQVVVLRGQYLTAEEEVRICYEIGDVEKVTALNRCPVDQNGRVISEIQRVTGMLHPDGTPMGLFGHDHDLDWHANRPSAEMERKPIIWLRSVYGSNGSRTSWANCTLAYNHFDDDFKNEINELYGIFGFEPNNYTSWNEWKPHRNYEGIKIVRSVSGLSEKVLFFPFLQLFGFKDKSEEYFKRISNKIRGQILKEEFIYHHDWQDGDVVISEQWGTIHKRWECDVRNRMLHRISFGWDNIKHKDLDEKNLPL